MQGLLLDMLGLLPQESGKRNPVLRAIAEDLKGRGMHEDAAVAYTTAGDHADALLQYQAAGQWQLALALAGLHGSQTCSCASRLPLHPSVVCAAKCTLHHNPDSLCPCSGEGCAVYSCHNMHTMQQGDCGCCIRRKCVPLWCRSAAVGRRGGTGAGRRSGRRPCSHGPPEGGGRPGTAVPAGWQPFSHAPLTGMTSSQCPAGSWRAVVHAPGVRLGSLTT